MRDAASIMATNRVDSNAAEVAGRASTRWRDCFFRGRAAVASDSRARRPAVAFVRSAIGHDEVQA